MPQGTFALFFGSTLAPLCIQVPSLPSRAKRGIITYKRTCGKTHLVIQLTSIYIQTHFTVWTTYSNILNFLFQFSPIYKVLSLWLLFFFKRKLYIQEACRFYKHCLTWEVIFEQCMSYWEKGYDWGKKGE